MKGLRDCIKVWKIRSSSWGTTWKPCWGGCRTSSMGRATILSTSQRGCTPFSGPKFLIIRRVYPKYTWGVILSGMYCMLFRSDWISLESDLAELYLLTCVSQYKYSGYYFITWSYRFCASSLWKFLGEFEAICWNALWVCKFVAFAELVDLKKWKSIIFFHEE